MRYAVLLLMMVLFIPACAAPVAASTNEEMTVPIAAQFDSNGNNMIEKNEAIDAVIAYFNGEITKEQVIDIIILYFSNGPIQEQVSPPSLAEVIAQVRPSVVKIQNDTARSQGSGVICKTEGQNAYVITNQQSSEALLPSASLYRTRTPIPAMSWAATLCATWRLSVSAAMWTFP